MHPTPIPSTTAPPSIVPWATEQAVIEQVFFLLPGTEKVEWGTEFCTSIPHLLMVISGKITHEMGMNTICSFFRPSHNGNRCLFHPHWAPPMLAVSLQCSTPWWLGWSGLVLGMEESAHGLGSQGLGSRVSEGNLHHASKCPDEPLTSSCKYRINRRLDALSKDLLS